MKLPFVIATAIGISLAALTGACHGAASTGASTGAGAGTPGGPYQLKTLDQSCFGITGNQALANASPSYSATFTYGTAEPNAGTTTALTLGVQYAGGAITCNPPRESGPSGPSIAPHVTVDVTATFKTADGAFNETLGATLDAFASNGAELSATIPKESLAGTYNPNLSGVTNVTIAFDAQMAPAKTSGNVMKRGQKSPGVSEVATVGSW
jgi:hypothetical protein